VKKDECGERGEEMKVEVEPARLAFGSQRGHRDSRTEQKDGSDNSPGERRASQQKEAALHVASTSRARLRLTVGSE
jgi:hypothetical protein